MLGFAEYYGEKNKNGQGFKRKKLSFAADHFDFSFEAHDSLEDTKATLHVFWELQKGAQKVSELPVMCKTQEGRRKIASETSRGGEEKKEML